MNLKKDAAENSIVDFIDDDEYYQVKKYKDEIEKGTFAIYIFAAITLLNYLFYFLRNTETFDWIYLAVNTLIIIIYFGLGLYSNQKPFTAFIAVFSTIAFVFLANLFLASEPNFGGILIKIILVVYLSMRLEAAKKVQAYENKYLYKKTD